MQEIIDQVFDAIRGAWRFRRVALVVAWVFCIAGWAFVLIMPNKYEAVARVFVDPTTSLRPVIQGLAVEHDVNAELNLVRQSLLSEVQLSRLVSVTGLGDGIGGEVGKQRVIADLRSRINISVQGSSAPGVDAYNPNPSKIYSLSYTDSQRERALQVVDILLNSFVEGTLGGKRQGTQQAQRFLETQIREYENRLSQAEERLAEFKKRNVGMVPGEQQSDYFTRLQTEMDAVKRTQSAINLASTRREALQRQLRGEVPVAVASTGTGQNTGGTSQGDSLSRIKETQARLDDLLLRFTDKHPEVIATRATLEELKVRRNEEIEALKRGDPNAAASTGASSNPVYQSIQLALNQVEVDLASLRSELADRQQKVADLRRMVDTMPQVEAEYARLNRDYTVTRAQYTALAERLEKARVGEEADASGAVRFEVIDPPNAAFDPVSPKRLLLIAAILVMGVGAGISIAYLLNLLQPVFHNSRTLSAATGLTVLGAVSLSLSDAELAAQRRKYQVYAACMAGLFVIFVVAVYLGLRHAPLLSA